jgi:hypothetical protein
MGTESEKARKAELEKWLVKVNPDVAKRFREAEQWWDDEEKKDPTNKRLKQQADQNRNDNLATAKGRAKLDAGADAKAKADADKLKKEEAKKVKDLLDWEKKTGKSINAIKVLMSGLQQLGDERYLKSSNPVQKLPASGEPAIDKLLDQVDEVFVLWKDSDKLPQSLALWTKIQPILLAVLAEGEKNFDSDGFAASRNAIFRIGRALGVHVGFKEEKDLEGKMETPDIGEALDLRELKKLEPALNEWKLVNKQIGKLGVGGGKIQRLSLAVDVYFSAAELSDKLAAFKKAGFGEQLKTAADVTAFFSGETTDAAKICTEAAKKLAEKAGQKEVAEIMEKRLKFLNKIAGVVALYDLVKSIGDLVSAIEKGDWHEVASSGFGVASSGIGLAADAGVISGSTAVGATGIAFIVWVEVDTIMGVAELHRWAKMFKALEAVKKMMADAKKIVPAGRKMAAAAQLMLEMDSGSRDAVEQGKYAVHEQEALRLAGPVAKAITALGVNHVFRDDNDKGTVGSYPALIRALGQPTLKALDGLSYPEDPMSVSERFKVILIGIKSMVTEGNKLYGDAGPGVQE